MGGVDDERVIVDAHSVHGDAATFMRPAGRKGGTSRVR